MRTSVGLDIGWRSVKAVELIRDLNVTKFGKVDIPRPINEGEENEVYTEKIKNLFNSQKFSKDNVIINIRGSYILTRTYLPSSVTKDDFQTWFVESIESLIPGAPISDVIFNHQFLHSGRVLISFARLRVVQDRIKLLKDCDIVPRVIDASCIALYYVFKEHSWMRQKKNFAILDVGDFNSDLLIIKEGEPFVSTEIMFGGKNFKKGKDKYRNCFQGLAVNLEKTLHFYKERENLYIEGLILVGDCSNIPGLRKNLKNLLGIKTQIGYPFIKNNLNQRGTNTYAQALGLALKGLDSENGINLMPPETKRLHKAWQFNKKAKKFFKRNIIVSSIVFGLFVFLLTMVLKEHHKIAGDVNELSTKQEELSFISIEEQEFNSKMLRLKQLNTARFFWSQLLYNLGSSVPEGINLRKITTESRLISTGDKPHKRRRVVIEGGANTSERVITFIMHLEKYFKDITVNKIVEESGCEFEISLTL